MTLHIDFETAGCGSATSEMCSWLPRCFSCYYYLCRLEKCCLRTDYPSGGWISTSLLSVGAHSRAAVSSSSIASISSTTLFSSANMDSITINAYSENTLFACVAGSEREVCGRYVDEVEKVRRKWGILKDKPDSLMLITCSASLLALSIVIFLSVRKVVRERRFLEEYLAMDSSS